MQRIAHLSDVHILDAQARRSGARYRLMTKFVGMGRSVDPRARAKKLSRALAAAKASGAEHFVISGDLTEIGDQTEFEHFAELLYEAKIAPEHLTLVPGNHDAYTANGWKRALEGPLAPYAKSSASAHQGETGKVVDRGNVVLLPIDSSCFQTMARAGGEFTREAARMVERRVWDPAFEGKAIVLVMHHSPFVHHKTPLMQWIDGLRGCTHVMDLLARHPRLQILHGHLHRVVDRIVGKVARSAERTGAHQSKARVFGAPAVCDDRDDGRPRVRLYHVERGYGTGAGAGVSNASFTLEAAGFCGGV